MIDKTILKKYDLSGMHEAYDQWPKLAAEYYEKPINFDIDFGDVDHIVFAGMRGSGAAGEIIYADELISGLPEWFKTTASWWAEDKITNEEMMKSVEYLRDAGIVRPRN